MDEVRTAALEEDDVDVAYFFEDGVRFHEEGAEGSRHPFCDRKTRRALAQRARGHFPCAIWQVAFSIWWRAVLFVESTGHRHLL